VGTRRLRRYELLVLVLLAGCVARVSPLTPTTADALLASLTARRAAITSLRARVHVKTGLARLWTHQALLVQRPAAVRIDVLSPFGLTLALGTLGDTLWAYPPAEGVLYEGPATPANLARFVGAPVEVPDLVDILLGVAPNRQPVGPVHFEVVSGRVYQLTLPLADGAQLLRFSGDTLELQEVEEVRDERLTMRVKLAEYEQGFPRRLDVEVPATTQSATLAYDSIEPNAPLARGLFEPPGAERVLPLEAAAEITH
jgi:hypothetical protein